MTTIDISTVNNAILYAGTDDGNVWVSKDDGANWEQISNALPNRWVTKVHADPFDESSAYVTFSGYRYYEYLPHIFKTNDYGSTWEDLSGGLPQVPINDLVVDPVYAGFLYIATDFGVFVSYDDGLNWGVLGESLPNVPITDLDIHPEEGFLIAATYGRSMYKIDLFDPLSIDQTEVAFESFKVYPNPLENMLTVEWDQPIDGSIRLELINSEGKIVELLLDEKRMPGPQRYQWNASHLISGGVLVEVENGEA